MPDASFRLYFGDRAASEDELGRIEEISVEQEMDMAWEAQLKLGLCLDERGRWRREPEEFAEPFSRIRVELKLGSADFQPLIDGPVVSYDSALDSEPGSSTVTLVVRDDSVLMNREEGSQTFEDMSDDAIASEVFEDAAHIHDTRIESTEGSNAVTVRRSTRIQFLRKLAKANGYHAYVLPGEQPGESIGCFLPDPRDPGDLPPLKLLGGDRNLEDISVTQNNEGPERTVAHTLRISDQEVVSSERGTQDVATSEDFPAIAADQSALRQVPAQENDREDPAPRANAQASERSFAYKLTGTLLTGCYSAVLTPYQMVRLQASDLPISGDYLLTKVKHKITSSAYTQEIEAKRNSRSDPEAGGSSGAQGLSVDFAASVSVF